MDELNVLCCNDAEDIRRGRACTGAVEKIRQGLKKYPD